MVKVDGVKNDSRTRVASSASFEEPSATVHPRQKEQLERVPLTPKEIKDRLFVRQPQDFRTGTYNRRFKLLVNDVGRTQEVHLVPQRY